MDMALESRVERLERRIMYLTGFCGFLILVIIATFLDGSDKRVSAAESPQILHLRGLVIDDAQGHARILLGAPFPKTPDRIRQDATTTGMLFLDRKGHDRFFIGKMFPAQIKGKVPAHFRRIGSGYGLTIFDAQGNERGGMGFLSNGNTVSRASIVLDRPGGDAWGAMVDDKTGFAGTVDIYAPEIGQASGIVMGTQGKKAFMTLKDIHGRARSTFAIGPQGAPSFRLFDENGKPSSNLLNAASNGKPQKSLPQSYRTSHTL